MYTACPLILLNYENLFLFVDIEARFMTREFLCGIHKHLLMRWSIFYLHCFNPVYLFNPEYLCNLVSIVFRENFGEWSLIKYILMISKMTRLVGLSGYFRQSLVKVDFT